MAHGRAVELAGLPGVPGHAREGRIGQTRSLAHASHTLTTEANGDSVAIAWTANYAPGLISFDDYGNSLATDASGNIYVTGSSNGDYLTIKYDSWGAEQWVSRYSGIGDFEGATAIAVDASGNVYVTGQSHGSGTSIDFTTVKYDASGTEQWVARYDGPGNNVDIAYSIAIDALGNVYVTGGSEGAGASVDYATVKYNASGVEQWVARYNGPGNSSDVAIAIAIDASGNVFVTGSSVGLPITDDYATVKYDASGTEQWVARYDGPASPNDNSYAIALDASGNVCVTGKSYGASTPDYATVRYNSSGVEQWVARYDGPGNSYDEAYNIALDISGNVYVTGSSYNSGTDLDYATVKYDTSGAEQWVAIYDGPGNSYDEAYDIALDESGNVYVTGLSDGSDTSDDYATVKYNALGVEQWVARYNGPGNSVDYASAIALDASGNVYVTGSSYGSGAYDDYATVKYDTSGAEQWIARYNGPGDSDDYAHAIAFDVSGNVYVTGSSYSSGSFFDYATVKYEGSGAEQWVVRYDGPGNSDDNAHAIALDVSGNVYVTGSSYNSGTDDDYATVKYDPSGAEQWVAMYDGPGNSYDEAYDIALDASGNVYVTGWSDGSGTSDDYATVKYNASGEEQWVARYNEPGNSGDHASAIALDASGNVYVTGSSYTSDTNDDYATVKYNSSGEEQWVVRYSGPGRDGANAISLDASGNLYVTGSSVGLSGSDDYATVRYDTSGTEQWVARYSGPGNFGDEASAIAIDASGSVYVTGWSYGTGTLDDYATVKYNTLGVEQWIARYDGPENSVDHASAIAVDASGNVYVTGSTTFERGTQYTTIKYQQTATSVVPDTEIPQSIVLHQNYPNPFNPSTTIRFSIPTSGDALLKIFNLLGEEVATLASGEVGAGVYSIQWDATGQPSGMYFYRLQAGGFTETRKLVLLR